MYPLTDILAELRLYFGCTLPLLCKPTPFVQRQALKWLGWLPKQCHAQTALGFTLAEVLIALAILGVIATFTIPKVMVAQQNQQKTAIIKELVATFSQINGNVLLGTVDTASQANYLTYVLNSVNAIKVCSSGALSGGCLGASQTIPHVNFGTYKGFLLANGANGSCGTGAGAGVIECFLDWNGADQPNSNTDDQLVILLNYTSTSTHGRVGTVTNNTAWTTDTIWQSYFQ